ncbi:DMT family transporter [Sulfitobacter geojensis]|uniref:EamA family transporter n=1 Tax=Sulfitobacter geojensis TaxID=1342299 RepID=A0AAE2VXA0_9RHOB|nr:DMT family transporter [Sulfitobacter geojensis]MBM1688897.1 EamA family transporter [Sulfitobacter geojensis]MBM1692964.1 EamA family transporter [Sulfitobacter geojensis]MBM1705130.1 EamA family transporter [Sulfitobacter geojensis]MBM1709188.1 EamA family transporter [Sulfitobacter geojensis]MBM1713253.1 EamA family transporter [Sulfitobacter geojensis]
MSAAIVAIILSAALLHAVWNAIVKTAADRTSMLGLVALGHVIPATVMIVLLPLPNTASLPYIAMSTVVHWGYYFFLGRAYAHGELGVVYPIARGVVPALVSLWAFLLLGEVLPVAVWLGIALIVTGILLSNWRALKTGVGGTALALSFGTGLCISVYSVVDGIGVRLSGDTLSYWAWGAFLHLFIAGFAGLKRRNVLADIPARVWAVGISGGIVSMIAYGLVLYAKNFAPLGAVSALRETSVIFATLIGYFVLKEGNLKRRLAAAVLMSFGIAMIGLNTA